MLFENNSKFILDNLIVLVELLLEISIFDILFEVLSLVLIFS
jgi:hypothetical protein